MRHNGACPYPALKRLSDHQNKQTTQTNTQTVDAGGSMVKASLGFVTRPWLKQTTEQSANHTKNNLMAQSGLKMLKTMNSP